MKDYNFLFITLDSCRWDVFASANLPNFKQALEFHCAYTQGTYTLPAHIAIYAGALPSVRNEIPYYNRFCKQLIRLNNRKNLQAKSLVDIPPGAKTIVHGMYEIGYSTYCLGAVGWFQSPLLTEPFEKAIFTGIHAYKQLEIFSTFINSIERPFFSLINLGETHEPYKFGGLIRESVTSRVRSRLFEENYFQQEDYFAQIEAVQFLDKWFSDLLVILKSICRDTVIVVCADHGECFGEDGLYGHGFYHEKIMAVPLGIGLASGQLLI